jgi:NitT/TauT family transport system substrate-binding protein
MTPLTRRSARRTLAAGTLATIVLGAVAACGSTSSAAAGGSANRATGSSAPAVTLRIGYIADVHGAGLVKTADAEGYWSKAGVNAQTSVFSAGPAEITAIQAGKLDIAYIGPGALYSAMAGKVDVIAIDSTSSADALVANPSVVPDLQALKGKKIGYAQGTSSQMILDLALAKAGLTAKDVDLVPMAQTLIPTAFLSGQIQVASPFPAGTDAILSRSSTAKVLVSDSNFAPQYVFPETWVASPALVKDHPQEIVAFLKAFILASDYRRTHLSSAISLAATAAASTTAAQQYLASKTDWLSSAAMLADNSAGTTDRWFSALNSLFVTTGQAATVTSPAAYNNTALFKEAYNAVYGK